MHITKTKQKNILLKGRVKVMWTRKELKARAKASFKRSYWKCVLVAFILTLDEFVKIPAVYKHYVKYTWVKNITRDMV